MLCIMDEIKILISLLEELELSNECCLQLCAYVYMNISKCVVLLSLKLTSGIFNIRQV